MPQELQVLLANLDRRDPRGLKVMLDHGDNLDHKVLLEMLGLLDLVDLLACLETLVELVQSDRLVSRVQPDSRVHQETEVNQGLQELLEIRVKMGQVDNLAYLETMDNQGLWVHLGLGAI